MCRGAPPGPMERLSGQRFGCSCGNAITLRGAAGGEGGSPWRSRREGGGLVSWCHTSLPGALGTHRHRHSGQLPPEWAPSALHTNPPIPARGEDSGSYRAWKSQPRPPPKAIRKLKPEEALGDTWRAAVGVQIRTPSWLPGPQHRPLWWWTDVPTCGSISSSSSPSPGRSSHHPNASRTVQEARPQSSSSLQLLPNTPRFHGDASGSLPRPSVSRHHMVRPGRAQQEECVK